MGSTLRDRTVVIFGGTSGIGLAAARQAKAAGASVIVVGFNAAGAERVAEEFEGSLSFTRSAHPGALS
ncbi:SDR family NAD(P)-dependent oxidoreductase [Methylobacterium oryzihabitans]|uniref:SDR family NAD(P)-dependent oxidoreductase n=1 Tax=Methylobacterium oryzihabitans TaxID=2499852 RepID=UPI0026C60286